MGDWGCMESGGVHGHRDSGLGTPGELKGVGAWGSWCGAGGAQPLGTAWTWAPWVKQGSLCSAGKQHGQAGKLV